MQGKRPVPGLIVSRTFISLCITVVFFIVSSENSGLLKAQESPPPEETVPTEEEPNNRANSFAEEDFFRLEELLVVTATRTAGVKLKEAPAVVYIITQKQVRARGYRTLEDALHDVVGFDFQHVNGTSPVNVHQRGLAGDNQRTLVYIDGILDNIISPNAVYGGTLRFPLQNVERIEIVSGPASALYGANAFNGVINIITKNGKDHPGNEVRFFGESYMSQYHNGGGGSFTSRNSIGKRAGYSISGYYYKSNGPDFRNIQSLDANGKGYWWSHLYNASREENYNITGKFFLDNFRLELINWQNLQGTGTFANGFHLIDTDRDNYKGSAWNFRANSVSAGYLLNINKHLSLDSEFIARHTEVLDSSIDNEPVTKTPEAAYSSPDQTTQTTYTRPDYSYKLEERLQWRPNNKTNITLGGEVIHFVVPRGYSSYERVKYQNFAAYTQVMYRLFAPLSITAGYRFDYNTTYGESHTPRISAVFSSGHLTLKALFSTGFRAPSAKELYNQTTKRKSNPNLTPETLISGELGAGYRLLEIMLLSVHSYYNRVSNLIFEVDSTEANPNFSGTNWRQFQNAGDANIIGIEIQGDIRVGRSLFLFMNYNFLYTTYTNLSSDIRSSPAAMNSNESPNIAPHKINAGITWYLLDRLSLHLRGNYVYRRKSIATSAISSVDGYVLLHANISFDDAFIKGLYFRLLARNLLDTQAFDPGIRSADGDYYPTKHPIEGRYFRLSCGYRF
ncbi:MAG: TonB-dependent receptor [bacterium]|nr:TonB-dependent receptor [bacterium]